MVTAHRRPRCHRHGHHHHLRGQELHGCIAAVAGAIVVALITFASMQWLGGLISKLSRQATALLVRVGGVLLAIIGAQMFLGGLKNLFGL